MPGIFDYLQEKLISDQAIANGEELNFFFTEYKPPNEDDGKLVKGIRKRLDYFSYAGLFLGLSLAVSLRRYTMPSQGFPFTKLLVGVALPITGLGFCLKKATLTAIDELHDLRKKLLEKDDDQYFEYLQRKCQKFPRLYKRDYDLVDEIISPEEFETLKKNSKKDFATLFILQNALYSQNSQN